MARSQRSWLGSIALGAGAAAVGGFGAAAGRDAWRKTKNPGGLLLVAAVFAAAAYLPFRGFRNIVRGSETGDSDVSTTDVLCILAGPAIVVAVLLIPVGIGDHARPADLYWNALAVPLIGGVFGILLGLSDRPAVRLRKSISAENERFLELLGMRETGESEITHFDGEGNALRVMERTADSIVFMAVGKRNRRAYLSLDRDGRMVDYSGVVQLGAPRGNRSILAPSP